MTITEIENLSFAELKARKESLVEAANALAVDELASRYIQARTDAKGRDEKLLEQGKTIEALTVGNAALQERLGSVEAYAQNLEKQVREAQEQVKKAEVACLDWQASAMSETERANKAESLAKARRLALAKIMEVISPVLAAE